MTRFFTYIACLCIAVLSFGCRQQDKNIARAEKWYAGLKDNEARAEIMIGGKEFYGAKSLFSGQVTVFEDLFSMTISDQFQGKMIVSMGGKDWYVKKPIVRHVVANDQINASVKMGRLVDAEKMIGEGYMLADGEIKALVFTEDKIVLKIKGKAGKYSDFMQPDEYLPVEGLIVYKKPSLNMGNLNRKQAFGSNTSN